jgi:Peptidase M15
MKYFKTSEFDSPDTPGSGSLMCPVFLAALDNAREIYARPMKVNSGYRTRGYAALLRKRGYMVAKNSSHFFGCAADIQCPDIDLIDMLEAFWRAGFRRFGIMATAIHVDSDAQKPRPIMWDYPNTVGTKRLALAQAWLAQKLAA